MVRILQLECDDTSDPDVLAGLVAAMPGLQGGEHDTVTRRCLDTVDGRLRRRGLLLEADTGPHGTTLSLRGLDGTREPAACRSAALPKRAGDVRDRRLRRKVREAAGRRPLRPWLECRIRQRNYACLDAQHKTVARLVLEQCVDRACAQPSRVLASLVPKRGYAAEAKRFRKALKDCLPARRLAQDRSIVFARMLGAPDTTSGANAETALTPATSPATALAQALSGPHAAMRVNQKGMRDGEDPEYLHGFRIAVRRSRSLIAAFPQLFGDTPPTRYLSDLAWYSERTSRMRDLDVLALEAAKVPDAGALLPVLDALRRKERSKVRRMLASKRHAAFSEDFAARLEDLRAAVGVCDRPVTEIANRAIVHRYHRVLRRIRKGKTPRSAAALHKLRKDCKKLRYLIEAFAALYPPRRLSRAVKVLKRLQDGLGRVCDTQVRHTMLTQWRAASTRGELAPDVIEALGRIVEQLDQRDGAVDTEAMLARFAAPASVTLYENLFAGRSR